MMPCLAKNSVIIIVVIVFIYTLSVEKTDNSYTAVLGSFVICT